MDKLENWITWGLLFALLYQQSQPATYQPVCSSSSSGSGGWGVTNALASSMGLSGFQGTTGCNCK